MRLTAAMLGRKFICRDGSIATMTHYCPPLEPNGAMRFGMYSESRPNFVVDACGHCYGDSSDLISLLPTESKEAKTLKSYLRNATHLLERLLCDIQVCAPDYAKTNPIFTEAKAFVEDVSGEPFDLCQAQTDVEGEPDVR